MNEGKHFNEKIRQVAFLLLLVFVACLIVEELRYFASSVLGGFTLFMVLRRPHRYLCEKGWSATMTTVVLMVGSFIFLVLVVGGLLSILYGKLQAFKVQDVMDSLRHIHDFIMQKWGYNIFSEDVTRSILGTFGSIVPKLLTATGSVIANLVMMMFVLFFMLHQRKEFETGVESLIPLSSESIRMLRSKTHAMVIGNAVGIPLVMFGQAVTSGFGYWLFDAGDPIIWGIITGFVGLIPVIGTGGVWVPLAINQIAGGHVWQGIMLIVYGCCVVSSVDYVVRIYLLKKSANVHPLVTLFGVILGMRLFGFWGIIFGPLILSCFFLLLDIYKKEFITGRIPDSESCEITEK